MSRPPSASETTLDARLTFVILPQPFPEPTLGRAEIVGGLYKTAIANNRRLTRRPQQMLSVQAVTVFQIKPTNPPATTTRKISILPHTSATAAATPKQTANQSIWPCTGWTTCNPNQIARFRITPT